MSNGKFYDIGWHTEFKSAKKRKYNETCIYLDDSRECKNKNSYNFLSKCFDSTHCPHKIKSNQTIEKLNNKNEYLKRNQQRIDINISIVLYNCDKLQKVELFTNSKPYNELPELHKLAFNHEINDEFNFRDYHYKVLEKHDNRTYAESFKIIEENTKSEPLSNYICNNEIEMGDFVTLYSCSDNDIIEFTIGENYNKMLENACIGRKEKDNFVLCGNKYVVQYVKKQKSENNNKEKNNRRFT